MNLTKYEHACLTLEKDDQLLVIDPGAYTTDFIAPEHVVGIVLTHNHPDHYDHELVTMIMDRNPEAVIIAHPSITHDIEAWPSHAVEAGDQFEIGPFGLEFFGGEHATISPDRPSIANLGVLVDDLFYYPGDSFTVPDERAVDTLALPVAAPWLKASETLAFLSAIQPRLAFPTHDAILSPIGKELIDDMVGSLAESSDIIYRRITELEL
jgi:L-ascorbate metabolism protein UlaG (beta-lactamase superfamily)